MMARFSTHLVQTPCVPTTRPSMAEHTCCRFQISGQGLYTTRLFTVPWLLHVPLTCSCGAANDLNHSHPPSHLHICLRRPIIEHAAKHLSLLLLSMKILTYLSLDSSRNALGVINPGLSQTPARYAPVETPSGPSSWLLAAVLKQPSFECQETISTSENGTSGTTNCQQSR